MAPGCPRRAGRRGCRRPAARRSARTAAFPRRAAAPRLRLVGSVVHYLSNVPMRSGGVKRETRASATPESAARRLAPPGRSGQVSSGGPVPLRSVSGSGPHAALGRGQGRRLAAWAESRVRCPRQQPGRDGGSAAFAKAVPAAGQPAKRLIGVSQRPAGRDRTAQQLPELALARPTGPDRGGNRGRVVVGQGQLGDFLQAGPPLGLQQRPPYRPAGRAGGRLDAPGGLPSSRSHGRVADSVPSVTGTVCPWPDRVIVSSARWPGSAAARAGSSAPASGVGAGPSLLMTSPARSPARSAAPPGVTATIAAPRAVPSTLVTVVTRAPSAARCEFVTCPDLMICPAMSRARLEGMAKPMPCAWPPPCALTAASVGMPITWPVAVTSAPPLLPGLIGALVWIASGSAAAVVLAVVGSITARPVAEMMPSVTLPARPRGLPTASTTSPACALLESPNVAGVRPAGFSARITARSPWG